LKNRGDWLGLDRTADKYKIYRNFEDEKNMFKNLDLSLKKNEKIMQNQEVINLIIYLTSHKEHI
jgi:hypothetical protein